MAARRLLPGEALRAAHVSRVRTLYRRSLYGLREHAKNM
jgi:hypothetical protein